MSIDRIGHVIVGGGHFIERGGRLIQQCQERLPAVADGVIRLIGSRSLRCPRDEIEQMERERAATQWLERKERDREALERLYESSQRQVELSLEALGEVALSAGCAAAGDPQGALEHGIEAVSKVSESFWEGVKDLFGRSAH